MGKRRDKDCEGAAPERPGKSARVTKGKESKDTPDSQFQLLEPKPYFVTIALGAKEFDYKHLNGILSYDVSTGKSSWRRQSFTIRSFYEGRSLRHSAFQVEGLIYCHTPRNLDQQGVYSIHTKTWHLVPPPPEISEHYPALGMTVDTSVKPYSFKLFQGSLDKKTQVYDSKSGSWSIRSSVLGSLTEESLKSHPMFASCTSCNGYLYLYRERELILVYSIEGDSWSILRGPPRKEVEDEDEDEDAHNDNTLGAFEGRIFTTREVFASEDDRYVVVWELVDQAKSEWSEYARISGEPYEWLSDHVFFGHDTYDSLGLVTCYCNEYLFLYYWSFQYAQADGYVLFNLATKECKKVDLPQFTIKTEEEDEDEDWDGEDEDSDEDEEDEEDEEEGGEEDEEKDEE